MTKSQKVNIHELLQIAAGVCGWKTDVKILVLSGFLLRIFPGLNPENFTNATARYCHEAGLPDDLLVQAFCCVIEQNPASVGFYDYIGGVANEFQKENAPAVPAPLSPPSPLPPLPSVEILVPNGACKRIYQVLAEGPSLEVLMGKALYRVVQPLKDDPEIALCLEVNNAMPRVALCVYLSKDGYPLAVHRPLFKEDFKPGLSVALLCPLIQVSVRFGS